MLNTVNYLPHVCFRGILSYVNEIKTRVLECTNIPHVAKDYKFLASDTVGHT